MKTTIGAVPRVAAPRTTARRVHVLAAACADRPSGQPGGADAVLSVLGTDLETGSSVVGWALDAATTVASLSAPEWELDPSHVCPVPPGVPTSLSAPLALIAPCLAAVRLHPRAAGEVLAAYDVAAFLRHQDLTISGGGAPRVRPTSPLADTIATAFGALLVDEPAGQPRVSADPTIPTVADVDAALATIAAHVWRFQPAITGAYTLAEWAAPRARAEDGLLAVVAA